jgi:mono/diheme cytochrome c family protein
MTKFLVAAPMLAAALSVAPALAQSAPAGDPVKGREKVQAYKSGERSHLTMKAIAASLSDNDMADIAAYYAQPATRMAGK